MNLEIKELDDLSSIKEISNFSSFQDWAGENLSKSFYLGIMYAINKGKLEVIIPKNENGMKLLDSINKSVKLVKKYVPIISESIILNLEIAKPHVIATNIIKNLKVLEEGEYIGISFILGYCLCRLQNE